MRSSTNRLAAALLAVLLLAAPAMAAPVAPERGNETVGWSSAFAGVLTDLSNLWDGLISHVTVAPQRSTATAPPTGSEGVPTFDPNGLATTTAQDGTGNVQGSWDPDG